LGPERFIQVWEARPGEPRDDLVARLRRADNTYEIEAPEGVPVWVNGARVTAKLLERGDMIKFGKAGPLSRFWCYGEGCPVRKTIPDILSDSVAYLRASRQPVANRVFRASGTLLSQPGLNFRNLSSAWRASAHSQEIFLDFDENEDRPRSDNYYNPGIERQRS
jgi:hypothetical protein